MDGNIKWFSHIYFIVLSWYIISYPRDAYEMEIPTEQFCMSLRRSDRSNLIGKKTDIFYFGFDYCNSYIYVTFPLCLYVICKKPTHIMSPKLSLREFFLCELMGSGCKSYLLLAMHKHIKKTNKNFTLTSKEIILFYYILRLKVLL